MPPSPRTPQGAGSGPILLFVPEIFDMRIVADRERETVRYRVPRELPGTVTLKIA